VPQIGESATRVRETSKLSEIGLTWLFQVEVFTGFNCELVTTQGICIASMLQIEKSTNGVWETSKLGVPRLI
jgi:hypothetical protein